MGALLVTLEHSQAAADGVPSPVPPVYRGHPVWGTLPEFSRDTLGCVSKAAKLGDLVALRLLPQRTFVVGSPEVAMHVLVNEGRKYSKRTRNYWLLTKTLGQGLVTSDGELWKKQRRTIQPGFHRQRIAAFASTMTQTAVELVEGWRKLPPGEPLDVHREMMKAALWVVCRTLLSIDVTDEVENIGHALDFMVAHTNAMARNPLLPPDWVPTPANLRYRRERRELDRVVEGAIDERYQKAAAHEGGTHGDLLDMLIAARDEETGEAMDRRQLRDEVMTLFLAGHETTANGMSWALYLLSQHPDVAEKLRAEVDGVLGGRLPSLEDLPRLTLLERVVKEALRLYPPAWLVERTPEEPEVLGGHALKPGDVVMIPTYTLHRLEKYWPDPERFDPDRFLPEAEAQRPRGAYLPFILGNRKCIGDTFALMEMRLLLATILQKVTLTLAPGRTVVPEPLVTLRPKGGVWMQLQWRSAPSDETSSASEMRAAR